MASKLGLVEGHGFKISLYNSSPFVYLKVHNELCLVYYPHAGIGSFNNENHSFSDSMVLFWISVFSVYLPVSFRYNRKIQQGVFHILGNHSCSMGNNRISCHHRSTPNRKLGNDPKCVSWDVYK